jgi:hypothetical protein
LVSSRTPAGVGATRRARRSSGPDGGAGQFPGQDGIAGPDVVAEAKGRHLLVDRMAARFGLSAGAR